MTATLDLQPEASHVLASAIERMHGLLDEVLATTFDDADSARLLAEWERATRRMDAVKLRLVAAAARADLAADSGLANTGAWLARQTLSDAAPAARAAALADKLSTPDEHASAQSPTGAALDRGVISTEHAGVVVDALAKLPGGTTPLQRNQVEHRLLEQAQQLTPGRLRRAARRALSAIEPDESVVDAHEDSLLQDQERRALAKTRLTLHDNRDGTVTGHFTVPTVAAAILRKVLNTMTSPRRGRLGDSHAQAGELGVDRDWAHERGLAFADLLERVPTEHLHGKVAASVVVTISEESLRGGLKAAGLDAGDLLSVSQARRLACQSGILPAVLDGESQTLDLGRTKRFFTESQRVAGAVRHADCAADGCDVPYAWCHLHHRQPWSHGGGTDLHLMVPLCGFHHRRIHDTGYLHQTLPDGSIRFALRV